MTSTSISTSSSTSGEAVVVGASMAGLLAARVLAEWFARVTVLDRDVLPTAAEHTGAACPRVGTCTPCSPAG